MSPSSTSLWMGANLALRRLRGRPLLVVTLSTVVFATLASFAERRVGGLDAATRALQGPVFGLAIPLSMMSLVSLAFGGTRVESGLASLALLGANRRAAIWGALPGVAIVGAFLASVTAGLGAMAAHGFRTPGAASDAWTTAQIAALAGAAYVGYFGASSTLGAKGRGRLIAFAADLLFGSMAGMASLPFPRAHALNLLGAEPVVHMPQSVSAVVLGALALGYAALTSLRTRR